MRPLIFLDFDGVLNSLASSLTIGCCDKFDRVCVGLVDRLSTQADADVVISSSWRIGADLEYLRGKLWTSGGKALADRVVGKTPRLASERGSEIAMWLADHRPDANFVIIDDDSDMLDSQKSRFVHTAYAEGFTFKNYLQALEILAPDNAELKSLSQYKPYL
jgi:hypothetical protein